MRPSEKPVPPVRDGETAVWRNLRLRPTRLGAGLLLTVVLLWLAGLNYQANLAYAAAFWLLGFTLAAALQNIGQLLGLRLSWQMPSEIFSGTPSAMILRAEGKKRRRWLWARTDMRETWQPWRISDGLDTLELPLEANLRGYLRVPQVELASAAPFGICTVSAVWQAQGGKIVFPAPAAHDAPAFSHGGETNESLAVRTSDSGDLSHLQEHENGTPLQHIAWKAYAKTGQLLDKRFEAAKHAGGSRTISYRDYPQDAGTDTLAGWLCWRVLEAERQGAAYELELPDQKIVPQPGQREISLTALALW